jgi:hypothetical protein
MKLLEYSLRPKSDYIMLAAWEDLYKLTEYWKKELEFYLDEVRFFDNLIGYYNTGEESELNELVDLVKQTRAELRTIMVQTDEHLAHLGKVIKEVNKKEDNLFREEHNVLEDNINAFTQAFRQLKNKIYSKLEHRIHHPQ